MLKLMSNKIEKYYENLKLNFCKVTELQLLEEKIMLIPGKNNDYLQFCFSNKNCGSIIRRNRNYKKLYRVLRK